MEKKTLQDYILAELCRQGQNVAVITTNGYQIRGQIVAFDRHTIMLAGKDGQQLTYKHAISTIIPVRPIDLDGLRKEDA